MQKFKLNIKQKKIFQSIGFVLLCAMFILTNIGAYFTYAKYVSQKKQEAGADVAPFRYSFTLVDASATQFINSDYWYDLKGNSDPIKVPGEADGTKSDVEQTFELVTPTGVSPEQPTEQNMTLIAQLPTPTAKVDGTDSLNGTTCDIVYNSVKYGTLTFTNNNASTQVYNEAGEGKVGTFKGTIIGEINYTVNGQSVAFNFTALEYTYSIVSRSTEITVPSEGGTDPANPTEGGEGGGTGTGTTEPDTSNLRWDWVYNNDLTITAGTITQATQKVTNIAKQNIEKVEKKEIGTKEIKTVTDPITNVETEKFAQKCQSSSTDIDLNEVYTLNSPAVNGTAIEFSVSKTREFSTDTAIKTTNTWLEYYNVDKIQPDPVLIAMNSPHAIQFKFSNSKEVNGNTEICGVDLQSTFCAFIPVELMEKGAFQLLERKAQKSENQEIKEIKPVTAQCVLNDIITAIKNGETTINTSGFEDCGEVGSLNQTFEITEKNIENNEVLSFTMVSEPGKNDNPTDIEYCKIKVERAERNATTSQAFPRGVKTIFDEGDPDDPKDDVPTYDLSSPTLYMDLQGETEYYYFEITSENMIMKGGELQEREFIFEFVPTDRVVNNKYKIDGEDKVITPDYIYNQQNCTGWHYTTKVKNPTNADDEIELYVECKKVDGSVELNLYKIVDKEKYLINKSWDCNEKDTTTNYKDWELGKFIANGKDSWKYNPNDSNTVLDTPGSIGKTFKLQLYAEFNQYKIA